MDEKIVDPTRIPVVEPDGWLCLLSDCAPGPFIYQDSLCFKTKSVDGTTRSFDASGSPFTGGEATTSSMGAVVVQPVVMVYKERNGKK